MRRNTIHTADVHTHILKVMGDLVLNCHVALCGACKKVVRG